MTIWSAMLCTGSLLLLPLAARSSVNTDQKPLQMYRGAVLTRTPAIPVQSLRIDRDPFVPDLPKQVEAPPGGESGTRVIAGATIAGSANISSGVSVLAVVIGGVAEALVSEDGQTRIVNVGARCAGSRIIRISSDGIVLANGQRLQMNGRGV